IPMTATHKYQKTRLKQEGIDIERCGKDKLFVIDREKMIYVPLEGESHKAVASGTAKL
ncbi:7205_t:CDS:1, partial [Paraglomus occultum]